MEKKDGKKTYKDVVKSALKEKKKWPLNFWYDTN